MQYMCSSILVFALLAQAATYPLDDGAFEIDSVRTIVLKDAARKKSLEGRVTYPRKQGSYPLIVFSHGLGGSKDLMNPLVHHWARHGYVVLQATHSDSAQFWSADKRSRFLQGKVERDTSDWQSRPLDVKLMLDQIAEIERQAPGVKGKIDKGKIGMGGHSFGAHTTMLIGGAKPRTLGSKRVELSDKRVACLLMISPQGKSLLLGEDAWRDMKLPSMTVTGSNDRDPFSNRDPVWRKDPYLLSPPGDKFLVWIADAYHGFGGICGPIPFPGSGKPNADQVNYVKAASLSFWDSYLKTNQAARAYLESNALTQFSKKAVTVSRR